MRIGISTSVIQRGKTGIAQYTFALLKALRDHADRHEFTIFALEDDRHLFDPVSEWMDIVPLPERFRPPVLNIAWHQTRLPGLCSELGLDLLHIPSYRRMLWSQPCPLVATIHDLAPFKVRRKYDWKRMLYGRLVVPRLAHRQKHLIAISQNTARDIQSCLRVPPERITVIHNGIDHARFNPGSPMDARAVVSRRYDLRSPFLLYVARLEHPAKNHVRLISAFEQFQERLGLDWDLVLAGSDWQGADVIHAAIARSPSAKRIRCLGFVPDSDLPDLYRSAACFVFPSMYEGFGMPPLEAMGCGCPVISSARGSLGEVLGDAAVIVEPEDISGLAGAMCKLATVPDLVHRLRDAGVLQAARFHWGRTAAATVQVYEKACNSTSGLTVTADRC